MKVPVLLPNIFNHPFTYESGNLKLNTGDYVNIPFGKSTKITFERAYVCVVNISINNKGDI